MAAIQKRQGLLISSPEEIAFRNGWIDAEGYLEVRKLGRRVIEVLGINTAATHMVQGARDVGELRAIADLLGHSVEIAANRHKAVLDLLSG